MQLRIEEYAMEYANSLCSHHQLKSVVLHVRQAGESSNDVPYPIDRICLIHYKNLWLVFDVDNVQDYEREMYSDEYVDTNNMYIDFSTELKPCNQFEFDQMLTVEMNIKKWWNSVKETNNNSSLRVHMLIYERAYSGNLSDQ
jgi:hypothetical protein